MKNFRPNDPREYPSRASYALHSAEAQVRFEKRFLRMRLLAATAFWGIILGGVALAIFAVWYAVTHFR